MNSTPTFFAGPTGGTLQHIDVTALTPAAFTPDARPAREVSDRRLRGAIAMLALAGAAVAAYLVYARYTGTRLACTTGGCETVQHSKYAKAAGVPVAVLGLVALPRRLRDRALRPASRRPRSARRSSRRASPSAST